MKRIHFCHLQVTRISLEYNILSEIRHTYEKEYYLFTHTHVEARKVYFIEAEENSAYQTPGNIGLKNVEGEIG